MDKIEVRQPFRLLLHKLFLLGLFAIAMGALEAIVVIYLRQLYYPHGFDFPLTLLSQYMVSLEWLRETATILMLAAIGILSGKNPLQKFACFIYTFAIWDIFYYLWLKLLLDWPPSLFTWDVLFLIPVPWIGPVLAPVICSLTMILFAAIIFYFQYTDRFLKITPPEWSLILAGSVIILFTFVQDYSSIIFHEISLAGMDRLSQNNHFWTALSQYRPISFDWFLFVVGEVFILLALVLISKRTQ